MTPPTDAMVAAALRPYGIISNDELSGKIRTYISLLLKWNRSISLTTITDISQILRFHFGESLFAISLPLPKNGRLADVGSGAGFPGIPLAMLLPAMNVTLIESNGKKAAFLSEVARELRVANVNVVRGRMEDVHKKHEEAFDLVTARAVGQFAAILDFAKNQLSPSGRIVLWLGESDVQRLMLGYSWHWNLPAEIPGSERRFILFGSPD